MVKETTATGTSHPKRRRLYWVILPMWAYIILISVLSAIPTPPPGPTWLPFFDKIEHIIEYGILGVLAGRFVLTSPRKIWRNLAWWLFPLLISAYGYLDEFHQLFVPGRSYELLDWAADSLGGILGLWLTLKWGKSRLSPLQYR